MPKTPKQATINFAGVFNVQTEKNKIIQVFFFEPFADSKPRINMSMPPLQKSLRIKNYLVKDHSKIDLLDYRVSHL